MQPGAVSANALAVRQRLGRVTQTYERALRVAFKTPAELPTARRVVQLGWSLSPALDEPARTCYNIEKKRLS